jgi:hypothetical protein
MSALPTRLLRQLASASASTADLEALFPAYRPGAVAAAIERLAAHGLIQAEGTTWSPTTAGRRVLSLPSPPRWGPARHSSPRTATIAR